jgi:hypothetical protein
MDILLTIAGVAALALMIFIALSFGAVMLVFIACVGVTMAVLVLVQRWWLRWRFVNTVQRREQESMKGVIEADYVEIVEPEKKDKP